jgi:hypothetical protein
MSTTELPLGFITDPEKKVQGTAMYMEFKNEYEQIFQMFITPDGISEVGQFVIGRAYYRRLSASEPKKQWKTQALKRTLVDPMMAHTTPEHREERLESLAWLMKRVSISSHLVGKPFFVEVSKKDLADIASGKTPTKVVHRIGQSRTALNYPEMFTA